MAYTFYFLTLTAHALSNDASAAAEFITANKLADAELALTPPWNRRLTLERLRCEAATRIAEPANSQDPQLSQPPLSEQNL